MKNFRAHKKWRPLKERMLSAIEEESTKPPRQDLEGPTRLSEFTARSSSATAGNLNAESVSPESLKSPSSVFRSKSLISEQKNPPAPPHVSSV